MHPNNWSIVTRAHVPRQAKEQAALVAERVAAADVALAAAVDEAAREASKALQAASRVASDREAEGEFRRRG